MHEEEVRKLIYKVPNITELEKEQFFKNKFSFAVKVLKRLKKYVNFENKKVLDIGSSHGDYLIHFGPESVGVECRPDSSSFSKNLGLKTLKLNIEDSLLDIKEKFDIIFCRQVLDHLVSPHKFLMEAHSLLNKKGQILISIDNIDYLLGFKLPSEHLYGFNLKSFEIAIEKAGFKILKIFTLLSNRPYLFEYLFNKLPFFLKRGQDIYILAEKIENYQYQAKRIPEFTPSWLKL